MNSIIYNYFSYYYTIEMKKNKYMEKCSCLAKRRWKWWYCSNCWYNKAMDRIAEKEVKRVCKEIEERLS